MIDIGDLNGTGVMNDIVGWMEFNALVGTDYIMLIRLHLRGFQTWGAAKHGSHY